MKPRRLIPGFILVAAIAVFIFRPEKPPVETEEKPEPVAAAKPQPGRSLSGGNPTGETTHRQGPREHTADGRKPYDTGIEDDPRVQHTDEGTHVFLEAIGLAADLGKEDNEAEQDLEQFSSILSFYRRAFEQNPVAADNQSVMAALMGDNPRSLVFFPEDHPSLNAQAELTDRWGTPYYFHALSGTRMEVVSPGPDRKLGNDDDLIHTQRNPDDFFRGYTEAPPEPDGEE